MFDAGARLGAEVRRVESRQHEGQTVKVVEATRVYDTDAADLWDALTNPERIPRWFLPVEGELKLGGRYQLKGNAGGTITRCDPPAALDLTWEFGGGMSWVAVRLEPAGGGTRLVLEHLAPENDHWVQYGPGAVGVGWELSLMALGMHLASGGAPVDPAEAAAWSTSAEGKAFMRASAAAWGEADIAAGADPEAARAAAQRTAAFYAPD
ncbi:MAG: SRPBCC family protein [Caulobacterales bacterium]|nr:SRPBCC family protein [Caulobacterales bacterium]